MKAVRSRKHEDLTCDIAEGHLSASLCHLANISYRLGAEMPIAKAEKFSNDKNVNEFAEGMIAHLKKNNVDPETVGRFGASLVIDPTTERVVSLNKSQTKQANEMLFREYRKGFELKEIG